MDAAADAIIIEAEALEVGMAEVLALSDADLVAAAEALRKHLNSVLPTRGRLAFGTTLTSYTGVNIGCHVYRPDAGRPGLYRYHALRKDAHGPNLARVLEMLEPLLADGKYSQFGLPTPTGAQFPRYRSVLTRWSAGSVIFDLAMASTHVRSEGQRRLRELPCEHRSG